MTATISTSLPSPSVRRPAGSRRTPALWIAAGAVAVAGVTAGTTYAVHVARPAASVTPATGVDAARDGQAERTLIGQARGFLPASTGVEAARDGSAERALQRMQGHFGVTVPTGPISSAVDAARAGQAERTLLHQSHG